MAARKAAVKVTANFEANPAALQAFPATDGVDDAALPACYRRPDDLTDTVVPNLDGEYSVWANV